MNMSHEALDQIQRVELHRADLAETEKALRFFGSYGCEGLVLWAGDVHRNDALVRAVLVPPQRPIRSEHGVGYFVTEETLFAVNRWLSKENLALIAQVHSHPTDAYHSDTDDRYAIVTEEGGFSLVVPYFANSTVRLETSAIYRLKGSRWTELSPREVERTFYVEE